MKNLQAKAAIAFAALTMTVSTVGMSIPTLAATVDTVNITKTVATDGNTYAPNTTFNFTIEAGMGGSTYTENGTTYDVLAGVDGALPASASVTFDPTTDGLENLSKSTSISIDSSVFTDPGLYHYVVTETAGSYEGIVYSKASYNLYLFVEETDDGLAVTAAFAVQDGETTKSDDGLTFINNYGDENPNNPDDPTYPDDPENPNPNDSTHDVTFTKVVDGNYATSADKTTKTYDMSVTINGAVGEMYKVVLADETVTSATSGTAITVTLKADEGFTVYGLSENDTYTVVEDENSAAGFEVTYTNAAGDKNTTSATGTLTADESTGTITNTKTTATPTGLATTYGPYVLLAALVGGMGVAFSGKKKEEQV